MNAPSMALGFFGLALDLLGGLGCVASIAAPLVGTGKLPLDALLFSVLLVLIGSTAILSSMALRELERRVEASQTRRP